MNVPRRVGPPSAQREATVVCPRYPYPPVSGGAKRTLRLAECMQRSGLRITIVTDDCPDPVAVQFLDRRGWETRAAQLDSFNQMRRVQQHLLRLPGPRSGYVGKLLRETARGGRALIQLEGVIAASQLHLPTASAVIFSTHNVEAQLARSAASGLSLLDRDGVRQRYHAHRVARTEARTAHNAEVVICVSDADAAAFAPLAKRVVVAPNGVDDEFFLVPPAASGGEDVLFFGQFTYEPNLEGLQRFLADGWPLLARLRPRSRLLIAGEGSLELIKPPAPEAARVLVLGLVDDMAATLARARLTLVPIWRGGGTRLKVLEALAATRPVVGTSLGVSGIGFESGRHGLLAETPVELARAAAVLLEQRKRTDKMGEEGRRLTSAYRWERALAPAEEIYQAYASTPSSCS